MLALHLINAYIVSPETLKNLEIRAIKAIILKIKYEYLLVSYYPLYIYIII